MDGPFGSVIVSLVIFSVVVKLVKRLFLKRKGRGRNAAALGDPEQRHSEVQSQPGTDMLSGEHTQPDVDAGENAGNAGNGNNGSIESGKNWNDNGLTASVFNDNQSQAESIEPDILEGLPPLAAGVLWAEILGKPLSLKD